MGDEKHDAIALKQSRLHEVPNGWRLGTVGNNCWIRDELRFPINEIERQRTQGPYPYYGPTSIVGYIKEWRVEGTYALIGEDGDHFLKFSDRPMTQLATGKFNVNNHAHIIGGTERCSPEWFFHYFMHRDITNLLSRQGAGRYKLTKATLEKLPILLPPLPEQRKIADILGTWDEAIALTARLIAAKGQRKRGLMQQLLAGRRRFPGFEEAWQTVTIGDFLTESRSVGNDGRTARKITVKLYGKGVVPKQEKLLGSENTNYYRRTAGQFIYSKLDFLNGAFGIVPPALDGYESTLDLPCFDFTGDMLPQFFLYFVSRESFYSRYAGAAIGGRKARRIQVGEFLSSTIEIPGREEQERITEVLACADEELRLLDRKLALLRQQKGGLMQQLLTGKVRVTP